MLDTETIADYWDQVAEGAFGESVYWLAHPVVAARFNSKACGGRDYGSWVDLCAQHFVGDRRPVSRILSVGCGDGELERHLSLWNVANSIHGVDIAPARVQRASAAAREEGLDHLSYSVLDVEIQAFPHPTLRCHFF